MGYLRQSGVSLMATNCNSGIIRCKLTILESKGCRVIEVGSSLRRSQVKPPNPAGSALESDPLAQDLICLCPANLQGWRWCDVAGQPAPLLGCPRREKGF